MRVLQRRNDVWPGMLSAACLWLLCLFFMIPATAKEHNRAPGVYPGCPDEDFSPSLQIETKTHRNLALYRAAYHSSSYDYNLTAQLVTDGIITAEIPFTVATATSEKVLPRHERAWLLDDNFMTNVSLVGTDGWVQVEMRGLTPPVDSIHVSGTLRVDEQAPAGWSFVVRGSSDGQTWRTLSTEKGEEYPGEEVRWFGGRGRGRSNVRALSQGFHLSEMSTFHLYRIEFMSPNAASWSIGDIALFADRKPLQLGSPYHFTSAWKSAAAAQEWVYVDLGAICSIDRVVLHWIWRARDGVVQISDDAVNWRDIQALPAHTALVDDIRFAQTLKARYVRLLLTAAAHAEGYILSELQVYGRGGPLPVPKSVPTAAEKRIDLISGWRLQRASLVDGNGEQLSLPGFDAANWIIATVPATVLTSYVNIGAVPDPNYADNQLMISESFFYSDFWYRTEFSLPAAFQDRKMFLNFDGINWKADLFLNGHKLGRIEGAFQRRRFDATDLLKPEKNVLAVRIEKNATPGATKEQTAWSPDKNGGALGADNPTFHASIGWDWIPTIRGRNIGIWNDVYLSSSGPVTVEDPFVRTDLPLPDTTSADISVEVTLVNHDTSQVDGLLRGTFGDLSFSAPVSLRRSETKKIVLDPYTHAALRLKNPALWWPNGYGKQNLYDVKMWFETAAQTVSDVTAFKVGVREMAYSELGDVLKIWVNGRRFIGRGGNWGFPEANLRYRGREYDVAVRYHKDMNFTMIRNWVGQTGDDEFFAACDRHGVMVWQDFWLANPVDGPNPDDEQMFLDNVRDFVLRIRNHAAIGLYCGRNEGDPPPAIDAGIRDIILKCHPGMHYISNSAFGVVSGGGPYRAQPIASYFQQRATPKFHSEMGMPNIVTHDSYQLMIPDSASWPQGRMWGLHDFCLEGAQGGSSFIEQMKDQFGPIDDLREWLSLAQWVNYQGYRAMFEAQSKYRMGLLLWMSHPAWPSFVWQTYDYYFEPTAAYFGCKKASEPLHIQWNAFTDSIEVVNYHARDGENLTATAQLIDLDGSVQWEKGITLHCPEDQTVRCFPLDRPEELSTIYFIRLMLFQNERLISENFYWRSSGEDNLQALRRLQKIDLTPSTIVEKRGDQWLLTTELENRSQQPALMVRLKVVGEGGSRLLPVLYSDNYVSLMPGEKRSISMQVEDADTHGQKPTVIIEGLNVR